MMAVLEAVERLAALLPWQGRPIALHQVDALLDQGYDEVWVRSATPELLAALPHDRRVRIGPGPEVGDGDRYDCFHPIGAAGVDLREPRTVPHQGWLIRRQAFDDVVVFSEPLCVCPRWDTDYVHSYLVIGRRRALLVDTGTGLGGIVAHAQALCPDLIVIHTHADWDHVGGSGAVAEAYGLRRHLPPLPVATLRRQLGRRQAAPWRPAPMADWPMPPPRILPPPDEIDLGGWRLVVMAAPGHTPDGLALYDQNSGDLFAGDALYAGRLYARDRAAFTGTARRLRGLEGLRRVWGGHGPVPVSQADVDQYGQLVE